MKQKTIAAGLIGLATLAASPAFAGEWRWLGLNNSSGLAIAVDTAGITGPQIARLIPVAIALKETLRGPTASFDYIVEQRLIDCERRTFAVRRQTAFMANGSQTSDSPLDTPPTPAAAATLDDLVVKAVCENQWQKVAPTATAADFFRAVRPILAPPDK